MAAATRDLMQRVDPGRRELYQKRWQEWDQRAQARIVEWKKYMQPLRGRKVVAYHNSWPYFEAAFGLQFIGFVEPKPGLRPSPKHLALLGQQMTEQQVRVVMMEPWYPQSEINGLLKRTSCTAVLLPTISTAADGYLKWMEALVEQFGVAHGLPKLDDWRQLQKASNE